MKKKVDKCWSKHNLPEDLWPIILSRLPAKSLLRFSCVSKSWKSIIDDPNFCRLHLDCYTKNNKSASLFVIQGDKRSGANCFVRCKHKFNQKAKLACLGKRGIDGNDLKDRPTIGYPGNWNVVCSMDGLILLAKDIVSLRSTSDQLLLWNPSIRKFRCLPPPPNIVNGMYYVDLGCGFDPSINDYKHVRFARNYHHGGFQFIAVFSVRSGSWKTIPFRGRGFYVVKRSFGGRSVPFRGYVFFLAKEEDSKISRLGSFDMSSEVFGLTSLPVDDNKGWDKELRMVNGCCTLIFLESAEVEGSVWVLEGVETGFETAYWSKRYSFSTAPGIWGFLHLNGDEELLVQKQGQVVSLNVGTHERRVLKKSIRPVGKLKVFDYIESLLLLN